MATKADCQTAVNALVTKVQKGVGRAPLPSNAHGDVTDANRAQGRYDSIAADVAALKVLIDALP